MAKMLTRTADEYLRSKKILKILEAACESQEEANAIGASLEALSFAIARLDNPPLRRAQMEDRHGQPVFCITPWSVTAGGLVDVHRESVWLLGEDGVVESPWFYGGCTGKFYAWPKNDVDLKFSADELKRLQDSAFN